MNGSATNRVASVVYSKLGTNSFEAVPNYLVVIEGKADANLVVEDVIDGPPAGIGCI